tara:strand:- start:1576 stop:1794 length:219 start_codon:yes stop_codon:yes gene_type:complete
MKVIENIDTGAVHQVDEIEYFLDDDTMIGEIYIDGNLIYQSMDVGSESQLELEFKKEYTITESSEILEDFLD